MPMKLHHLVAGGLIAGFAALSATAQSLPSVDEVDDLMSNTEKQKVFEGSLYAIPNGRGELLFVTDSGRYMIQGQVFDSWNQITLGTVDDVKFSRETLDLDALGFRPEQLNPLVVGKGGKEFHAFISLGTESHDLIDAIRSMQDEAKFNLYVLPAGVDVNSQSFAYSCPVNKAAAAQDLIRKDLKDNIRYDQSCALSTMTARSIFVQYIGMSSIPTVFTPNDKVYSGVPSTGWAQVLRDSLK